MDRLNTPDSDKGNREVPLRTSEIKATYHEKRPSRIAPEPGFVSQNSLTKTKLLPQNAAGVSVEQYKDPGIKTTSDVLILGTSGSGKSLLLRRLKNIEGMIEADTLPTVGTDIDRVSINKKEILFREVGFKLVHSWIKFSRETKAIMFVVDLADYASISASVIEFYNILLCVEDLPTPVILVLNKVDRQDHLSIDTVLKMFEFSELLEVRENLYLYVISAASGVNTRPLADLLESIVGPNAQNQGKKKRKCCF